jgi:hypothetical protein
MAAMVMVAGCGVPSVMGAAMGQKGKKKGQPKTHFNFCSLSISGVVSAHVVSDHHRSSSSLVG